MVHTLETISYIISGVAVPFAIYVHKKQDELQQELTKFKIYSAENYAKNIAIESLRKELKEDIHKMSESVTKSLHRIENKLDEK